MAAKSSSVHHGRKKRTEEEEDGTAQKKKRREEKFPLVVEARARELVDLVELIGLFPFDVLPLHTNFSDDKTNNKGTIMDFLFFKHFHPPPRPSLCVFIDVVRSASK